jgi:integral membrane protein
MKDNNTIKWFLLIGKIEGYSYLVLLFIAMPLKYGFDLPQLIRPLGTLHGVLFVVFMILLAILFFKQQLNFKKSFLAFLLSLIPFGTFYLKRLIS